MRICFAKKVREIEKEELEGMLKEMAVPVEGMAEGMEGEDADLAKPREKDCEMSNLLQRAFYQSNFQHQ